MRASFNQLRSHLGAFLDIVLPPRPSERLVRTLTLEDLQAIRPTALGALPYHDPLVRALVWEIKYHANSHALALCGELLAERILEIAGETLGKPLLVPVPMHKKRRKERGHNQTELLCKAALRANPLLPVEYAPTLLVRTVHTTPQQGQPEHTRRHNVQHSMSGTSTTLAHARVCIVLDDVTTTGATLREASRALTELGAREIITLTLAHAE